LVYVLPRWEGAVRRLTNAGPTPIVFWMGSIGANFGSGPRRVSFETSRRLFRSRRPPHPGHSEKNYSDGWQLKQLTAVGSPLPVFKRVFSAGVTSAIMKFVASAS
jgi:hypothetical protein